MIRDDLVRAHRGRALTPERPVVRGTAQNPDTFFQAREAANPFYARTPAIVEQAMAAFARITGRSYRLFEYDGPADAEQVIVLIGSAAETARDAAAVLRRAEAGGASWAFCRCACIGRSPPIISWRPCPIRSGQSPCSSARRSRARPASRSISTSSPRWPRRSPPAERAIMPRVIGGRYGLSSKDFTPAMVKAVFDELDKPSPRNSFTVGITDDVSGTSLDVDPRLHDRAGRGGPRGVLRARIGRNGRREQEQRQDPRRRPGPLCARLFRLRFAQVRRADGVAPSLRAAPDPRALSDRFGELRRPATSSLPRAGRRPAARGARRDVSAQLPL